MREIKFRAWFYKDNSMHPVVPTPDGPAFYDKESYSASVYCDGVASDPMQYTGLKDVNGVEIYEGDIVEFTYWWFDGNPAESILIGMIDYSEKNISFQLKGVKNKEWERHVGFVDGGSRDYLTPFSELDFDESDFHVIGNIYENPELMESDDD